MVHNLAIDQKKKMNVSFGEKKNVPKFNGGTSNAI